MNVKFEKAGKNKKLSYENGRIHNSELKESLFCLLYTISLYFDMDEFSLEVNSENIIEDFNFDVLSFDKNKTLQENINELERISLLNNKISLAFDMPGCKLFFSLENINLSVCFCFFMIGEMPRSFLLRDLSRNFIDLLSFSKQYKEKKTSNIPLVSKETTEILRKSFIGEISEKYKWFNVIDRLESGFHKYPDHIAYFYQEESINYSDLWRRVQYEANYLVFNGLHEGDITPVLIDNSIELPIILLSLMYIGVPFLMVDVNWPYDRINSALKSLDVSRVICKKSTAKLISDEFSKIVVDDKNRDISYSKAERADLKPSTPIYGLFTSGSTGEPKCSINKHGGIANRFLHMDRRFGPLEGARVLQTSRPVYDGFIWQLFWPLSHGGTTYITEAKPVLDPLVFLDMLEKHEITMTDIVPSIFKLIVRALEKRPELARKVNTLRRILIGGEAINTEDISLFNKQCEKVKFTNTYGPTETSIGMIMHDVTDNDMEIPIGLPINNTAVLLVDEQMRLVPPGVVGEILIGGECVGSGYHNKPEVTKKSFIDSPEPSLVKGIVYRTGDLAYIMANGNIQYSGRLDDQVNIGGARIELSEIKKVINNLPEVDSCVVLAPKNTNGNQYIVSFISTTSQKKPSAFKNKVFSHLKNHLPRNYIPNKIIFVEDMPLMPNGKVNRKKLLSYLSSGFHADDLVGSGLEVNEKSQILLKIWKEVLKRDDITIEDDFFVLGGDSLQAMMLSMEIELEFSIKLAVDEIYKNSTFSEQLKVLSSQSHFEPKAHEHIKVLLESDSIFISPIRKEIQVLRKPKKIFMTGATGFVGSHILYELLSSSDAEVNCLVRATSNSEGLERLSKSMREYGLWREVFFNKIKVTIGDLNHKYFGIGYDQFRAVISDADSFVLSGAQVHFLYSYDKLKQINVESVREILSEVCKYDEKKVHFISSLSVFSNTQANKILPETDPEIVIDGSGYAQSKWVADRLARQSQLNLSNVSIYRLGDMMPSLMTGAMNTHSLFTYFCKAAISIGQVPIDHTLLSYMPVDMCSKMISEKILTSKQVGTFNIKSVEKLDVLSIVEKHAKSFGVKPSFKYVQGQAFYEEIKRQSNIKTNDVALNKMCSLLPDSYPKEGLIRYFFKEKVIC